MVFRLVAILTLVFTCLASCNSAEDAGNEPATELAGDGERVFYKLATAMCKRTKVCSEDAGTGFEWASLSACVDAKAHRIAPLRDVDCSPASDYSVDPEKLEPCLADLSKLECWKLLLDVDRSVFAQSQSGELGYSCGEVFSELVAAIDARTGAKAIGASCSGARDCGIQAYCDAGADACGTCRKAPTDGEACLHAADDGFPFCSEGAYCVRDVCKATVPLAGERCSDLGECAYGLDCGENGRCAALYREGSSCNNQSPQFPECGNWLECVDDKCQSAVKLRKIGAPCGEENDRCIGGICVKERCVARREVGENCDYDWDCLEPYACVDGKCVEVPGCREAKEGDICTRSDQCKEGLVCRNGEPSRCVRSEGGIGEPCLDRDPPECNEGECIKGVCKLVETVDACVSNGD